MSGAIDARAARIEAMAEEGISAARSEELALLSQHDQLVSLWADEADAASEAYRDGGWKSVEYQSARARREKADEALSLFVRDVVAQLMAAREDTARLDWMETHARASFPEGIAPECSIDISVAGRTDADVMMGESIVISYGYADEGCGADIRAAIDTARASEARSDLEDDA